MARRDFKGFKPRADRNTHKPRGETKQAFVDRVHGQVTSAESIQDLWNTYYTERFAKRLEEAGGPPLEPEHIQILRDCFYAGVSSMFYLMDRAGEGGESDQEIEAGAAKLGRLYDELFTYVEAKP